jgi:hypothetical protein
MAKKAKPPNPFAGRWRIVSRDEWEVDDKEEGPAFIEFGADQMGEFRFGLTSGNIDYRITKRDQAGPVATDVTADSRDQTPPRAPSPREQDGLDDPRPHQDSTVSAPVPWFRHAAQRQKRPPHDATGAIARAGFLRRAGEGPAELHS